MSQNFIAQIIVLAGTSMYLRDCAYSDVVTLTYVSTLAGQSQFLGFVPLILEETPPEIEDGFYKQNLSFFLVSSETKIMKSKINLE